MEWSQVHDVRRWTSDIVACSASQETCSEQEGWVRDRCKRHLSHHSLIPRSELWAFQRLCILKCWEERLFQGNLPLAQICCFPWGRNVIVLKTCRLVLFYYHYWVIFYFEGWGETNLKWNTSFWSVWPDWGIFHSFDWIGFKSIQNTLQLPSGKVQLSLFIMAVLLGGPRSPGGKEHLLCWLSPWE